MNAKIFRKIAAHDPNWQAVQQEYARRLAVDKALRSPQGMDQAAIAAAHGVGQRTIRRDLNILHELVGNTEYWKSPAGYRHRYAGNPPRLID